MPRARYHAQLACAGGAKFVLWVLAALRGAGAQCGGTPDSATDSAWVFPPCPAALKWAAPLCSAFQASSRSHPSAVAV